MHLKRKFVTGAAVLTLGASIAAALAMPASAAAPTSFPVYDNGGVLVTAHHVTPGERLVVKGRPVTLGEVDRHGPAYIAHVLGVLPASWKGHMLAAVVSP